MREYFVGQTIQSALTHMMDSEYTEALIALRPALDETARLHYRKRWKSRAGSVRFLDEHRDIIAKVGLNDIGFGADDLPFLPLDTRRKRTHSLGEVIYYLMRSSRKRRPVLFWQQRAGWVVDDAGELCVDPMLLSGIIMSIVGCPVNRNEQIENWYWLPSTVLQNPINTLWGSEVRVRQRIFGDA